MTSASELQKVAAQAIINSGAASGYLTTRINALASACDTSPSSTVPALLEVIFEDGFESN